MRVLRARTLGFCPGVRRAVASAEKAAADAEATSRRSYVLGEIVHNPRVSARLAGLGMGRLDDLDALAPGSLADAVVVVRSHGAAPATFERLAASGADIVDATCPKVAANQKAAASFAARGFLVVIAGDKGHGETLGVAGHAPGAIVVSSPEEALAVPADRPIALIAQTTISEVEYDAIRSALLSRRPDLADSGGVCAASRERQSAVEGFRGLVDAVVVVGGRNSANTRRLAELARSLGIPAWHVENAAGIPGELGAYETVGLSAGASTPDEDIDEAEARLLELARLPGRRQATRA
ncbi:MAG: 4-hydroxy-3-methylbut-2-enyl diphosphate reductase [Spirochaetae bacterium HGW-Spirochaetae-3]|jgi:4-hydroxy-3-methylbut-2-enyl diphosphate reductase|nr:MAG: 4-hydroxy-3-methylbut-2-enyl diphosphate reductase [Spirochaetae bacterium HGW-Spirochaetae-3]